jgi:hypothetical protein
MQITIPELNNLIIESCLNKMAMKKMAKAAKKAVAPKKGAVAPKAAKKGKKFNPAAFKKAAMKA